MSEKQKKLKKPSGTKAERLLSESTFYVDDCLGKTVCELLRADGWNAIDHREIFDRDGVDDMEIFEFIGKRGWILLTKDKAMRRKTWEIDKILEEMVRVFSLSNKDLTAEEMASIFIDNRLRIGRFIKNYDPPFYAIVQWNSVELARSIETRKSTESENQ
jgi:predicted nuclease of predicted toxin-antitoxin system